MENVMTIFKNEEFGEIRTLSDENTGEPWFCALDVCNALGYAKPRNAVALHVDEADALKQGLRSNGQIRELTFVNESGLYSLILSSKLPQAKQFKRWVTSEVLPSIRQHGAYMAQETINRAIREPEFLIELATNLKNEKEQRDLAEERCELLEGKVENMQEKVSYLDQILGSPDAICVSQIAADYGMDAVELNLKLADMGIQEKRTKGKQWLLRKKYRGYGYTSSRTEKFIDAHGYCRTSQLTKWTQLGREFIYYRLRERGILPICERKPEPTLFDNME